ncbi:A/G-specific adenine glycosylase [Pusillimonas harenae]|uniref:Adenine DNA glycosylase n=2 Tax=Pollutimonas harenae TaxID=657015 RepID=A0A853H4P2_9BURK|nr:A/G-specific adenine glycosylase [Pollutimonas harenae]TEA72533.1 A/G-specific adenine glycosylase [Pollutimonas harenae]
MSWQRKHGRQHLPWQGTQNPYRIWLSEIMLQQTQVATVIGYYQRFLERFPDIQALAQASQDEVMPYWAGLGYYARARNLHRCAQAICQDWGGKFPSCSQDIATLPGIGRSTAAAIAAFCFRERSPIMDGNVKRVFTRYFGIEGVTSERSTEQRLWHTAEAVLDAAPHNLDMTAYTQGLMDLGSQCCTRSRPACTSCPVQNTCYAHMHGRQHELPTPKKKKASPERQCRMLIARHADHILLEQQASPGIWGGLWSLPKYDSDEDLQTACYRWGSREASAQKMAGMIHVFTHFRLHIEPWYVINNTPQLAEPDPAQRWVAIDDLRNAALPAPVRKILEGLFPASFAPVDNG